MITDSFIHHIAGTSFVDGSSETRIGIGTWTKNYNIMKWWGVSTPTHRRHEVWGRVSNYITKTHGCDVLPNGPLTRYIILRAAHAPGMPVSDPDMHVPGCMPGSLTSRFLWSRWRGKRSWHSRRMRNPHFCVSGPLTHHDVRDRGKFTRPKSRVILHPLRTEWWIHWTKRRTHVFWFWSHSLFCVNICIFLEVLQFSIRANNGINLRERQRTLN